MKMIRSGAGPRGRSTSHDWIGRVDVPTAVIVIRRDQLVRAERQRKLAVAVPGATMHELDGDHAVGVREPVRFVPVIVDACLDLTRRVLAGVYGASVSGRRGPSQRGVASIDQGTAAGVAREAHVHPVHHVAERQFGRRGRPSRPSHQRRSGRTTSGRRARRESTGA